MYDRSDLASVERRARALVGRRFGDVTDIASDVAVGARSRGSVGHELERYFGLSVNSQQAPDFTELGVELKSVPVVRQGKSYVAKERTFITAIDYGAVAEQPFEGSALDSKTRRTLYVFYEWLPPPVVVADMRVRQILLHDRDSLDELALREAYEHVQHAVRNGAAHLLSESDTWGVGPATKDARGRGVPQPFGDIPARRRAFAWRPAYTTRLFQVAKLAHEPDVSAPDDLADLVRDAVDRLLPHHGRTVASLRDDVAPHLTDGAKSLTSSVTRTLIAGRDGRALEAMRRLGITIRTLRVDRSTLRPFEATSFPAFDFEELSATPWESSPLQEQLNAVLFVVWTAGPTDRVRDARLHSAFLWRPSTEDVDIMIAEYERFRRAIATSPPRAWPRSRDTTILHVRPHGRDGSDVLPLPTGGTHVRSAFWLNQSYLQRLVQEARPL